ncbi:MAG: hypothetical protein IJ799_04095 [Bacteroidales bacterium]|nr:hypothetical protein [Bacteroidales bacterium]
MKQIKTISAVSGYDAPELTVFTISVKRCLCGSWDGHDGSGSIPDGEENDMGSI